ncbi:MAG TPA: uracil-DNA glycosylase, partial [Rhodopila sp.]|nr:uracil-DNA glycosylase [Rhodopila sp.]
LALGGVAHRAVLRARGLRASHAPFAHGALHELSATLVLADSYHVSRLNTNTGRLTKIMFEAAVTNILPRLT